MTEESGRYVTQEEMDSTITGQNMRQGAFVLPIVDYDPTAETRGIEDGTVKLWVSHGRLHMSVYSLQLNGSGAWSTLSEEHIGTIKMFYGAADDIDLGWQLCDGTNGTPDLRDKFILGGEFDEIGQDSDGTATVIAAHSDHVVTQPSNHVFTQADDHTENSVTVNIADTGSGTIVMTNYSLSSHANAGVDAHSGTAVDAHSAHVVSTDYSPPYYKLAFIMKVA